MKTLILAFLFSSSCYAFAAEECPVNSGDQDYIPKVVKAIDDSANCFTGTDIAWACALGSSADEDIASAAGGKCASNFARNLEPGRVANFRGLIGDCDEKYKNTRGSIAISSRAFCKMRVSELFAELYGK